MGPGRLLVFSLDKRTALPQPAPPLPPISDPTFELSISDAEFENGERLYGTFCARCHGIGVVNSGITPDLRRSTAQVHELFNDIVLNGIREPLGMPRFDDVLNENEVRNLQGYILRRAEESAGGY